MSTLRTIPRLSVRILAARLDALQCERRRAPSKPLPKTGFSLGSCLNGREEYSDPANRGSAAPESLHPRQPVLAKLLPYSSRSESEHKESRHRPWGEKTSSRATARCETGGQTAHRPPRETWQTVIRQQPHKIEFPSAATVITVPLPLTRRVRTCSADVPQSLSNPASGECRRLLSARRSLIRRRCCHEHAHRGRAVSRHQL